MSENLARYRWHTGAALRRVDPDEPMPVLFRDIGPVALHAFLGAGLDRLSGPYTPLLYMRTASFREPFVDHAQIGRLVFLQARSLQPWHAGIPDVYVARAGRWPAPGTVAYLPGDANFDDVAAAGLSDINELREYLGGTSYTQRCVHERHSLQQLNDEAAHTERWAQPLRQALKSHDGRRRQQARKLMQAADIDDQLLCAAWHHLPRARRDHLTRVLTQLDLRTLAGEP